MSRSQKWVTLEISLRLRKTLSPSTLPSTETPLLVPNSPSVSAPPQPVADIAFTLGNLSDDILTGMDTTELMKLVIKARDTITSVSSPRTQPIAPSNLFSTPQSLSVSPTSHSHTPKMDRVRSVVPSNEVMTYTGSLIFLFHKIFSMLFSGTTLVCLLLRPVKRVNAQRKIPII